MIIFLTHICDILEFSILNFDDNKTDTNIMKSTVVPNPWRGAVYFILNIILWDVQTK